MKLSIVITILIAAPLFVFSQTKKTIVAAKPGNDRLLWYQGKKQNDSVLLTNEGWKILYKRTQNKVDIKTGTQPDRFQKIATELNRSNSRRVEIIRRIAGDKPDPSDLPTIRLVMAAIDDIESQYKAALKNSIDLPAIEPLENNIVQSKLKGGPSFNMEIESIEKTWQEMFTDIKADIRSLKDPNDIQLAVPPDFDVSICYSCDSLANKRRYQKRDDYLMTLKKDEQRIAQKIFIVFRVIDQMGATAANEITGLTKNVHEELVADLKLMHERVAKKLQRLIDTYQHDFLKMVNLVPLILGLDRQYQLLGLGELPVNFQLGKLMTVSNVNTYIKKLIAEEDYSRVLNISWIIATERQFQLLGEPSVMEGEDFKKVLGFNRFKLTVSADAKAAAENYLRKGQAKSEPTYYKAIPTRDCKFTFVQSNGNKSMGVGKPFLNFDLLEAASSQGTYVGTKKWVMIDPYIKIGFCGDDDTLKLFVIMPNLQEPFESWKTDIGIERLPEITGLFSDAFENNNNMVDEDEEMLEQLQSLQKLTSGLSNAEQIVSNPIGLNNGYAIVETIKEKFALNALTLVPVAATNKNTVLFDKLYNGKPNNTNDNIVYANLWIKLEHVKD